jgi:hypothetical protein
MNFRSFRISISLFLFVAVGLAELCLAERGFVLVQVQDTKHLPVPRLEIGIEGMGGSKITDDDGKAQLPVGNATKEADWLSLSILHSPAGQDFVMVSPWDNRVLVPSFEDKPENFLRIVVVRRGDRAALEDGTVLRSLAEKINKANSPKSTVDPTSQQYPKTALAIVAGQYGLSSDDVDHAIRTWGSTTIDPYEAGIAALYERDYPRATSQLQGSLQQREAKLENDQKTMTQDERQVVDAAFFLGSSLYAEGKYRESAQAYERCLQIWPQDTILMNNAAMSLEDAGDFSRAEILY